MQTHSVRSNSASTAATDARGSRRQLQAGGWIPLGPASALYGAQTRPVAVPGREAQGRPTGPPGWRIPLYPPRPLAPRWGRHCGAQGRAGSAGRNLQGLRYRPCPTVFFSRRHNDDRGSSSAPPGRLRGSSSGRSANWPTCGKGEGRPSRRWWRALQVSLLVKALQVSLRSKGPAKGWFSQWIEDSKRSKPTAMGY